MDSERVKYLGRIVEKEHFRTNVYAPKGGKKLVESWDEFEAAMASGLWFATVEDAAASVAEPEPEIADEVEKPKRSRKKQKKEVAEDIKEDEQEDVSSDDLAFEVSADDDFLPKESA